MDLNNSLPRFDSASLLGKLLWPGDSVRSKGVGRKGLKPPYIFSALHRNFQPNFNPHFTNFITTVHPIALQQWLMASVAIRFFSSLIPSNQRMPTNFCNFVTKVNKVAKALRFPGTFVHKAFRALL